MGTASPGPGAGMNWTNHRNELKSPIREVGRRAPTPIEQEDRPRALRTPPCGRRLGRRGLVGRRTGACIKRTSRPPYGARPAGPTPRGHPRTAPRLGPRAAPHYDERSGSIRGVAGQQVAARTGPGDLPATGHRLGVALTAGDHRQPVQAVRLTRLGGHRLPRLAVVLPASPDGPALLPPAHRVLQSHGDHRLGHRGRCHLVGALARRPRRSDLTWLAGAWWRAFSARRSSAASWSTRSSTRTW